MSWLPIDKLTTEEKEVIQDYQRRKVTLLGKYNIHIKNLDTTHETWIGNFSTQHKKRLAKYQGLYASDKKREIKLYTQKMSYKLMQYKSKQ